MRDERAGGGPVFGKDQFFEGLLVRLEELQSADYGVQPLVVASSRWSLVVGKQEPLCSWFSPARNPSRTANDRRRATTDWPFPRLLISAGLAGRNCFASLLGSGVGRRRGADCQIGGPEICKNLPCAGGLSHEDDQVFSALFTALTHDDGHEHFAPAEIERNITQHFDAQRFHLYVAQSGIEQRDEKLPDRGQAANRRDTGANKSSVGSVEFKQVVDVSGVTGLRPVLDDLTGASFGAAARGSTGGTGSAAARSGGLGLGRGRAR